MLDPTRGTIQWSRTLPPTRKSASKLTHRSPLSSLPFLLPSRKLSNTFCHPKTSMDVRVQPQRRPWFPSHTCTTHGSSPGFLMGTPSGSPRLPLRPSILLPILPTLLTSNICGMSTSIKPATRWDHLVISSVPCSYLCSKVPTGPGHRTPSPEDLEDHNELRHNLAPQRTTRPGTGAQNNGQQKVLQRESSCVHQKNLSIVDLNTMYKFPLLHTLLIFISTAFLDLVSTKT